LSHKRFVLLNGAWVYIMGNNSNPSYVFLKGNTYYFNRHVPLDVREYYKSARVILCLSGD
jgi:hypothetical protein